MKRLMLAVMAVVLTVSLAAGDVHAGEIVECIGIIKKIDREKGELVLQTREPDGTPGKLLTIMDNDRHLLRKRSNLVVSRDVIVKYEQVDDKNILRRIWIMPQCEG